MSDPLSVAVAWIGTTLEADATLMALLPGGVHDGEVPEDAPYPTLVIAEKRSVPTRGIGGVIILWRTWIGISAIDRETESSAQIEAISHRVMELLHGQRGPTTAPDGLVYGCEYLETEQAALTVDDVPYRTQMSRYQVVVT